MNGAGGYFPTAQVWKIGCWSPLSALSAGMGRCDEVGLAQIIRVDEGCGNLLAGGFRLFALQYLVQNVRSPVANAPGVLPDGVHPKAAVAQAGPCAKGQDFEVLPQFTGKPIAYLHDCLKVVLVGAKREGDRIFPREQTNK